MITHIVSDWLFSPCCVEHQDEFIFERVAVAYSRDYNEVGRAQIKAAYLARQPTSLVSLSIIYRYGSVESSNSWSTAILRSSNLADSTGRIMVTAESYNSITIVFMSKYLDVLPYFRPFSPLKPQSN